MYSAQQCKGSPADPAWHLREAVCACECVRTCVLPGIKAESILPVVHKWTAGFRHGGLLVGVALVKKGKSIKK